MDENTRLGYPLLLLGGLMALIEIVMIIWAYFVTNEFHSFGSSTAGFLMMAGFFLIKIDKILDNQKEIIAGLNKSMKNDDSEKSETPS